MPFLHSSLLWSCLGIITIIGLKKNKIKSCEDITNCFNSLRGYVQIYLFF
jgi:hypothetical protein